MESLEIQRMQPSLRRGRVGLIVEINQLAVIAEGLEAMRKTAGDQHRPEVFRTEDFPMPPKIRRGARTHIHRHVEYLARKT